MNTTTIKHKYNIGDKHFDFNREIDREHNYIFYISGITNVDGKVFYELSDIKGNKENLQQYHFGRWLIAEEDIIPDFEKYVIKRKKLLNRLVNETTNNLLNKAKNQPIYKDNINFYYEFTIKTIEEIIPGIFDRMLENQLKEAKRIKSTNYYRLATIFTYTTFFFLFTTIILSIILIIK